MFDSDQDSYARIFDFGKGENLNNIVIAREGTSTNLRLFSSGDLLYSPMPIVVGEWRHLCIVNQGTTWSLFENGVTTISVTLNAIESIQLPFNFLGRSNWPGDDMFRGKIDEFRIYKIALRPADVATVYSFKGYDSNRANFKHIAQLSYQRSDRLRGDAASGVRCRATDKDTKRRD